MKKLALLLLLLQSPVVFAADKAKTNPADFPIKLHISSSASQELVFQGVAQYMQLLETSINGQPMRLGAYNTGVLALGDYQARVSTKAHGPRDPNTYDIYQSYDLLLPDGTVRTFTVTRLGPAVPANP